MSFVKPVVCGLFLIAVAGQGFADEQQSQLKTSEVKAPLISEKYLLKKSVDDGDSAAVKGVTPQEVQDATQPTQVNGAVVDIQLSPAETTVEKTAVTPSSDSQEAAATDVVAEQPADADVAADGAEDKPVDLDLSSVDPTSTGRVNVVRDRLNWSRATDDMSDRVEYLKQYKEALELRNEIRLLGRGEGLQDMQRLSAGPADFAPGFSPPPGELPPGDMSDMPVQPQEQLILGVMAEAEKKEPHNSRLHVVEVYGDYVVIQDGDEEMKLQVGGSYKGKKVTLTKDGVVLVGGKAI